MLTFQDFVLQQFPTWHTLSVVIMFWRIGIMVQLIVHVSLKFFPEMSWPYSRI